MGFRERLNEIKLVFGFYGSTLTLFLLHPKSRDAVRIFLSVCHIYFSCVGILKFVLFGISSFIFDWPILLNPKVINCVDNNEPNAVEICTTA